MGDEQPAAEQVYIIGSSGSPLVKIGRTTNLTQRLAAIQRMSPVPLVVLCTYDGGSAVETAMHRHFKDRRTHGEWFDLGDDPVAATQAAIDDMERAAEEEHRRAVEQARANAEERARTQAAEEQARLRPGGIVYRLRDPRDGTIRYVGSSGNPVHKLRRQFSSAPPEVRRWIKELREIGQAPTIEIVQTVSNMNALLAAKYHVIGEHVDAGHPLLGLRFRTSKGGVGNAGVAGWLAQRPAHPSDRHGLTDRTEARQPAHVIAEDDS